MSGSVISYKLDLLIRLIDTTDGKSVNERSVSFKRDGKDVKPIPKGEGNFIFLNTGRDNFELSVSVRGFEDQTVDIDYEKLDGMLPIKEVFLIPSENTLSDKRLISISGTVKGLEAIEAVGLQNLRCYASDYDERKRIVTLYQNGTQISLEDIYYGLIKQGGESYEAFTVDKLVSNNKLKLRDPLKDEFTANSPIARIVFGNVKKGGEYKLTVRDDASKLSYIVRYIVKGEEKFKKVDFHELDGVTLD